MKTLIEKSIVIAKMGRPDFKTIFNIENEYEKSHPLYRSIQKMSGLKNVIYFNYKENDNEIESEVRVSIPANLSETEVKEFIITQINNSLI